MTRTSMLAFGLAVAASGMASGQVVQESTTVQTPGGAVTRTTTAAPAAGVPAGEMRRISQILGSNVGLQGNPNYGRVEDVIVGPNGAISHVVVGNGGRYAMLPWNAGNFNYAQRAINYNVTPQAIQPLFFGANAWPNMSDQVYNNRISRIFPNASPINRGAMRPSRGRGPWRRRRAGHRDGEGQAERDGEDQGALIGPPDGAGRSRRRLNSCPARSSRPRRRCRGPSRSRARPST